MAAGGGSANAALNYGLSGGSGGGISGKDGGTYNLYPYPAWLGKGGNQTTGYMFGQGQSIIHCGGGGGFYGGLAQPYSAGRRLRLYRKQTTI